MGRRAIATPGAAVSSLTRRAARAGVLLVAGDDATPGEVVGRQLDADAIAREHADAESAHLAGEVREHLMTHVELHAEVQVLERLDDLALQLHLLFDSHGHLLAFKFAGDGGPAPVVGFSFAGP